MGSTLKPFKVASFQTLDPKELQLSARELGHGMQTRSHSELASIRRELSEIGEAVTDEYARGFLDAAEHLLAGASAEVKHRRAAAEDVTSARLRRNATKVLLALHGGCDLPSDIAEKTGLKLPAVSNELSELEAEQLVERVERSAGEDQRRSPRALTMRGMRVAMELSRTVVSPAAEAARDLAPLFVAFINRLADESLVAPRRLEELAIARLGSVNGTFVCSEFLRHADLQRTLLLTSSALALTGPFYRRRLRDLLDDAQLSKRPALLEPMKQLAENAEVWLRATTAMRDQWQVALSKHDMRNVYPWCQSDVLAEQLPSPRGAYHIVWENPEVMTHDLDEQGLQQFMSKATRRLCYVATDLQLPHGVERIEFDAHHSG